MDNKLKSQLSFIDSLSNIENEKPKQYVLRDYQKEAVKKGVDHLLSGKKPGVIVSVTGSGKSLIIANIAKQLPGHVLVFSPSKELLEQNYNKLLSYNQGLDTSIFSASFNSKKISKITFCTIGSVWKKAELFAHFDYIIIDECDFMINPYNEFGIWKVFLRNIGSKPMIGLTASPFRLYSNSFGSILRLITRTNPKIFHDIIYHNQIEDLTNQGYISDCKYYEVGEFDTSMLRINSNGSDYTDDSVKKYYKDVKFDNTLLDVVKRLVNVNRKNILVFTKFVEEAKVLALELGDISAVVYSGMKAKDRDDVIKRFKNGNIKVAINIGVLTCLSEDTEILTRNKLWVKWNEVEYGDLIAQYDNDNQEITFENPKLIQIKKDFDEDMVGVESRHSNILVTHNHNMLYHTSQRKNKYFKKTAIELVGKKIRIPVSGFCKEESIFIEQEKKCSDSRFIATNSYNYRKFNGMSKQESKNVALKMLEIRNKKHFKNPNELSIDECMFIGFWLGDGSKNKPKSGGTVYSLCQSFRTPKMIEWIEKLLNNCNIDYSYCDYKGGIKKVAGRICNVYGHRTYRLCIGTGGHNQNKNGLYKLLPYLEKKGSNLFWGLNRKQFMALMEGLFKADGYHGNDDIKYTGQKIIGQYKELFDLLQAIAVCRGYKASILKIKMNNFNKKQLYNISLYDKTNHELTNDRLKLIKNKEKRLVWCVTMNKGNIITRRNGRVSIVGNTGFDFPELETVVIGRPMRSLRLYYQMIGRGIRPHYDKKDVWIVDLCGSYKVFGEIKNLWLNKDIKGNWQYINKKTGQPLTNVYF